MVRKREQHKPHQNSKDNNRKPQIMRRQNTRKKHQGIQKRAKEDFIEYCCKKRHIFIFLQDHPPLPAMGDTEQYASFHTTIPSKNHEFVMLLWCIPSMMEKNGTCAPVLKTKHSDRGKVRVDIYE